MGKGAGEHHRLLDHPWDCWRLDLGFPAFLTHSKEKGHLNHRKLENKLYHKPLLPAVLPRPLFSSSANTREWTLGWVHRTRPRTGLSIIEDLREATSNSRELFYFKVTPVSRPGPHLNGQPLNFSLWIWLIACLILKGSLSQTTEYGPSLTRAF